MNYQKLTYLGIFLAFTTTAQSIQVEYDYILMMQEIQQEYSVKSKLTNDGTSSIYEIDHTGIMKNSQGTNNLDDKTELIIKSKRNEFVFKNFKEKKIFYRDRIGLKDFKIKDSLSNTQWNLTTNTKEILGYLCQEAKATYGTREYTAYFTTQLNYPDGPWRFSGLPGLILEIKSDDDFFKLIATSIATKKEKLVIENPYIKDKLISWAEFLALYKSKYDEVKRNGMSENGPTTLLPKKGIVEYLKE
ncbi:GLPGLI family protein [Cellulophaga baltica]|uniref:GLPGLI family protein n=1 Tax=Cellulophaga baltica TaxID=76594 RepID=UPI0004221BDA|nr:GLPGLI family protein [Cellulophaga baltica]